MPNVEGWKTWNRKVWFRNSASASRFSFMLLLPPSALFTSHLNIERCYFGTLGKDWLQGTFGKICTQKWVRLNTRTQQDNETRTAQKVFTIVSGFGFEDLVQQIIKIHINDNVKFEIGGVEIVSGKLFIYLDGTVSVCNLICIRKSRPTTTEST